jgi:allantoicase
MSAPAAAKPDFLELPDLAAEKLGGSVLWATDDYFAEKENLLKAHEAEWREHAYTDKGKWMDGWESRRKRAIGPDVHDTAVVRLGLPGVLRGVVVDTAFFRGNFPEACSMEGTAARPGTLVEELLGEGTEWFPILGRSTLQGNSKNFFAIDCPTAVTHLKLRIFPDGGVARLRVHGDVLPDFRALGGASNDFDLAAMENGGQVLACSDMFFGPKHNLIQPGRAPNMSDGWETKRRRGVTAETHDWVVVKLVGQGIVDRLELDTNWFKGNFPDTARVVGRDGDGPWRELLPRRKLMAHTRHLYVEELGDRGPFTELRLEVYPDGGVSRMRVFGALTETGRDAVLVRHLAARSPKDLARELAACCAAPAWLAKMCAERPFASASELFARADAHWTAAGEAEWLAAFSAHPPLGQKKTGADRESAWSRKEQAGTASANPETLAALAEVNRAYHEKFGFVFLYCATGKSAEEMLAAARERLQNAREAEVRIAAEELRKIMHLRLRKLVG